MFSALYAWAIVGTSFDFLNNYTDNEICKFFSVLNDIYKIKNFVND